LPKRSSLVAVTALLALWAGGGPAFAQAPADVVISSGKEGGNYFAMAGRLRTLLTRDHAQYVEIRPSLGSVENLVHLDDPESPVSVAFTQADALNGYLEENPGFRRKFVVLADLHRECIFLFARNDDSIQSAADLKISAGRQLSVDRPGSGASVTYDYMTRLDPEFKNTEVVNVDMMEALAQLKTSPDYSNLTAAMLVQRPRVVSPALEIVLNNPGDYRIVPVRQGDLKAASLPSGKPVYTFETVQVRQTQFDTMCTRALLLAATDKLSTEVRSKLAEVLLESVDYIAPNTD
jgi:TRAP-type uncharacterized transport system substrate-binding protein